MKHRVVRKAVRMFAEAELGPIARDIDRDARFPWEVVEKMRPLQFFGLQAPKRIVEQLFERFGDKLGGAIGKDLKTGKRS
jgi:alkylation response protein AidB-like acyl-CoA dehydrogenase